MIQGFFFDRIHVHGDHAVKVQRVERAANVLSDTADAGRPIGQAALMGAKPADDLLLLSLFKKFCLDHSASILSADSHFIPFIPPAIHSSETRYSSQLSAACTPMPTDIDTCRRLPLITSPATNSPLARVDREMSVTA